MKKIHLLILLLSFCSICYSQKITKKELKQIIKKSIKENNRRVTSPEFEIVTNNKDSIFFKAEKIEIFTTAYAQRENNICRTIELKFLKKNRVNFMDCQVCTEPTSCYVTKDKNIYNYKIEKRNNNLYINFFNKYNEMKFKFISFIKKTTNKTKYYKIEMIRVK